METVSTLLPDVRTSEEDANLLTGCDKLVVTHSALRLEKSEVLVNKKTKKLNSHIQRGQVSKKFPQSSATVQSFKGGREI